MTNKPDIRVTRLSAAIEEAERFVKKAKEARKELQTSEWTHQTVHYASAKRSSMDLTRVLADVRRTPY